MNDHDMSRWDWVPEDYPQLPDRVRDNEEGIRENESAIEHVEDDIESIRSLVRSARKGIWTLVIQAGVAILGALVMYVLGALG